MGDESYADRKATAVKYVQIVAPEINLEVSNQISGLMDVAAESGPKTEEVKVPRIASKLWRR